MTLPKVSIVIPTLRAKSKPYLDLCIDAIRNLDYPKELLDVNIVSPTTYVPKYTGVKNWHHPDDNRNFAQAVNYGIDQSNQKSEHIFLLSDDTVPTKNSLKNLIEVVAESESIVQGISNCDNQWHYNLLFTIAIRDQRFVFEKRYFRIEDIGDDCRYLKDSISQYPPGIIFPQTLCFYACLIPRKVVNKLGLLDEKFENGYEDSDYCHRAKLDNVQLAICLNALIWHFGGATTSETVTSELSEKNKKYFFEKWK